MIYQQIKLDLILEKNIPFNVYIKDLNNHYIPIILSTKDQTSEEKDLLNELISINASFFCLKKDSSLYQNFLEKSIAKTLHQDVSSALNNEDFPTLYQCLKTHFLSLSIQEKDTYFNDYTLAKKIILDYLSPDDYLFKMSALSYFALFFGELNEKRNVSPTRNLVQIFLATYFSHYGLTQLPFEILNKSQDNFNLKEKEFFFSQIDEVDICINKLHLITDPITQRLIQETRQRTNLKGHPKALKMTNIHPYSFYIALVIHIFELSQGKLNGQLFNFKQILVLLKNKYKLPHLEFDFSESAISSIISLIYTDSNKYK